jgi:hypothetical protein
MVSLCASAPFRPELDLLLCACRTEIDVKVARSILEREIDWSYLVNTSIKQSVTALLFRGLKTVGSDVLPPWTTLLARLFVEKQRGFNLFLAAELVRILDALKGRGIEALPFKGPVLAATVYGDLGLRRFLDLDFMIHERDILPCWDVLRKLDYVVDTGRRETIEAAIRKYSGQDEFCRRDGRVMVEPHWAFGPSTLALSIDYDGLWKRARPVDFVGLKTPSFAPEDVVIMLCVHGCKEQWRKLQCICDVAEVIHAYPSLDWPAVVALARSQKCLRMVLLGLALASRLMGAGLPAELRALLDADPITVDLAKEVERSIFDPQSVARSVYEICRFRLRVRDSLGDKVRYVVRTVTTPRASHFAVANLPEPLFIGYYPLKLIHDYLLLPAWQAKKRFRRGVKWNVSV